MTQETAESILNYTTEDKGPMPAEPIYCVGYAMVPLQPLDTKIYSPEKGLSRGTIYPCLDLNIDEYGKVCKSEGSL